MKRNKITAVILSIVMSMSLMMPSVEVLADETSAPSETQKTEPVETKETKAAEKQTPKEFQKPEPKETEKQEPKVTETQETKKAEKSEPETTETQESKESKTQESKETETQEAKVTETQAPKETDNQEPAESDETQITETSGLDEKESSESEDNGETPEESNETTVVEGKIPSQSASTPKKNARTGTCGENLTWTFANGTLTISGSGEMRDFYPRDGDNIISQLVPWKAYSENISSVVFSGNITTIGNYAFYDCKNLTSITIPNSVFSIGEDAFLGCRSLSSITIPNSVISIGGNAFGSCTSLTSITIPNRVTSIARFAFSSCISLTSITIPNSVTSIGENAFSDCASLTSITIPDSVTSIGNSAFYVCTNLTSITIPSSVTSIGGGAFSGCKSLESITIPNSVTSISSSAFSNCTSLTSITIPNSVTSIGYNAFKDCSGLTSITIPNSVTTINQDTFSGCTSLTDFIIPNNVTSIGHNAFRNCNSLTSITIPNSVTSFGSAFYGCTSLTNITIPNSVTTIEQNTFRGCSSLTNIIIPNNVTSIGDYAFYGCTTLTNVYYESSEDKWKTINIGSNNESLLIANIHYGAAYSITVNSGISDLAKAAEGTTVTVTANAAPSGKVFDKWAVVSGNVMFANELSSTTTFTMPAENVKITATYKDVDKYTIKINNGSANPATAIAGTVITLTADAAPSGKAFDKWMVDSGTVYLSNASSSTTTFTMPAENVEVTAIYKDAEYTIKVNNGSATPATATAGTVITITADAAPYGKAFDKWIVDSETVSLSNASSSTTTFTMPAKNVEVTATYIDVEYTIKVNNGVASPATNNTTASFITALAETKIILTADDAPSGKVFDKWIVVSGSVKLANSGLSSVTWFTMPDENVEVTATYKDVPAGSFVIKVNNGNGNTTSLISAPGLVVNVKASDAPAGTEFEKWEVVSGTVIFANASSAATFFVMPAGNVEITARYKSSLSVKGKTATVKYSKVKKKNQTLSVSKVLTFVNKGQGKLTYAKVSGNSKISINKTTGTVTVKKKLKKKTYTVKVKVQASGNESCNPSGWKTVTFKIKVK